MKHDLQKLRQRLADECRGVAQELADLPPDADTHELRQAELILRDLIGNARAARNLIERAKAADRNERSATP